MRIGDVGVHIPWPTATFDAVVLLDVLDRVADDVGAALEVKRVLRPGGHVLIEGPNAGGLLARVLGTRWAIRRDPRVVRLYDVPALVALFGYQGFRMRAWGTHFDLYRAGGSTPVFAPLRRIGGVWPGCGAGERAVLLAQKPLLDLPAWNQRRP